MNRITSYYSVLCRTLSYFARLYDDIKMCAFFDSNVFCLCTDSVQLQMSRVHFYASFCSLLNSASKRSCDNNNSNNNTSNDINSNNQNNKSNNKNVVPYWRGLYGCISDGLARCVAAFSRELVAELSSMIIMLYTFCECWFKSTSNSTLFFWWCLLNVFGLCQFPGIQMTWSLLGTCLVFKPKICNVVYLLKISCLIIVANPMPFC